MNRLSRAVEAIVNQRALRNMNLAFDRACKRNAFPPWASREWKQFLKLYRKAAIKNYYCKAYNRDGQRWHVDHIVPLAGEKVCGLMVPWNLHVIPAIVNMAKGTMIVDEWLNKNALEEMKANRQANQAKAQAKREERKLAVRAHQNRQWDQLF